MKKNRRTVESNCQCFVPTVSVLFQLSVFCSNCQCFVPTVSVLFQLSDFVTKQPTENKIETDQLPMVVSKATK